jgi:hypothetical protein
VLPIVLALVAGFAPVSPARVEHLYSRGSYLILQPLLTSFSSLVPIALLDLWLVAAVAWLTWRLVGVIRAPAARGRAALRLLWAFVPLSALLYIAFLGCWGLNYRREPITAGLDFAAARVTPATVDDFARHAVMEMNQMYTRAHADRAATETLNAVRVRLAPAFAAAQRALGATRLATPGRPKRSLLSPFFRLASVDGMINPFGLEVLVNPDVLPVERPFVIAHEWGHLAGWARESEASFLGWLTCLHGDDAARYSGWLSLYLHARADLERDQLRVVDAQLAAGPRADLRAIAERLRRGAPAVQRASWAAYDRFLKANRVGEGVHNYDEVITLVVGTVLDDQGRPRPRR